MSTSIPPRNSQDCDQGLIRRHLPAFLALLGLMLIPVLLVGGWITAHGVSARDQPTAIEAGVARTLRHLAIPSQHRRLANPVAFKAEVLAEGRMHWADHCATCHGNDGRGGTAIGRNLYPKAPDMTLGDTQNLSDGELFAIIKNGIRLTGMPAWGDPSGSDDAQTWALVHFIRHLPRITPEELEEMKAMNPMSPMEKKEELEEEAFLGGTGRPDSPASSAQHPQSHATKKEKKS